MSFIHLDTPLLVCHKISLSKFGAQQLQQFEYLLAIKSKRTILPVDVEGTVAPGLWERCSHIIQNTCPNVLAPRSWPVFLTIQKIRYTIQRKIALHHIPCLVLCPVVPPTKLPLHCFVVELTRRGFLYTFQYTLKSAPM